MTKLIYLIIICVVVYVASLYQKKLHVAKELAADVAHSVAAKMASTQKGKAISENPFGARAKSALSLAPGEAALVLFNDRKKELKVTIRRVVPAGPAVAVTIAPGGNYSMKLDPALGRLVVESELVGEIQCSYEPDSYVGWAFN